MTADPLAVVVTVVRILDDVGIPYALGGSMASSVFGEPRATAAVDLAVRVAPGTGEALLAAASGVFYVPMESARAAIAATGPFNLLDVDAGFKVDVFVLGDGLLDRRQIDRRVRIEIAGAPSGVWVTSPEDQVLRKLDWYRSGGGISDRQWRDVLGLLRVSGRDLDLDDLRATAGELGLTDLLEEALRQADG